MGLIRIFDKINEYVGKAVSFLILAMIGVVIYDVLMRYFLSKPQSWAPEISEYIFGALFLLGAGYTYLFDGHVRMDVIYERLKPRQRAILDLVTALFFFLSCAILLWKGIEVAWHSIELGERTSSAFAPPLYPMKVLVPVGALLLMLQGIAKFVRDIAFLRKKADGGA